MAVISLFEDCVAYPALYRVMEAVNKLSFANYLFCFQEHVMCMIR